MSAKARLTEEFELDETGSKLRGAIKFSVDRAREIEQIAEDAEAWAESGGGVCSPVARGSWNVERPSSSFTSPTQLARGRPRAPVRGGLSYREAHLAMELVAESKLLDSFEDRRSQPILDRENETARLAVEFAASALGARTL